MSGVQVTNQELGQSSYAAVVEIDYTEDWNALSKESIMHTLSQLAHCADLLKCRLLTVK